jgi:uncharacterized protein
MFIGRSQELSLLREELDVPRPSLAIVYGRRRVGKSTLIREAMGKRSHILYQATRVTSSLNLEGFKTEISRVLGSDDLLMGIADWLGMLHYLARAAERSPGLIVVLDDFPYLADAAPALPSVVQKFWDSGAPATGNLKLLLCGSIISQMQELLAERNPLYGRKTLSLDLAPLSFREAAQFVPSYTAEQKLMTFGIFGGIPFYLQFVNPELSLQDNIIRLLLTQTGSLVDEPAVLLQSELREVARYASILAAIAGGCTKHGEIIGRVREISDSKALSPYLEKLERMRLIRIVKSMDAHPGERDRRYFIADALIAFWYRFVQPNLSSIVQGFGRTRSCPTWINSWDSFSRTSVGLMRNNSPRNASRRRPGKSAGYGRPTTISMSQEPSSMGRCSMANANGGRTPLGRTFSMSSSSALARRPTVATMRGETTFSTPGRDSPPHCENAPAHSRQSPYTHRKQCFESCQHAEHGKRTRRASASAVYR